MSNRPSKAQVDEALKRGDDNYVDWYPMPGEREISGLTVLCREVRALRERLASAEALSAKWRKKANRQQVASSLSSAERALVEFTLNDCADELSAALKGGT